MFWYLSNKKPKDDILKVPQEARKPLILRGMFGFGGNIFAVTAFKLIPLTKATVIINTNPIFIAIFGVIILKEHISGYDMGGIFVTFIGVVIFLLDSFQTSNKIVNEVDYWVDILGCLSAFGCSMCTAGALLSIRKVGGRTHVLLLGFSWALWNSLMSPLLMF